jgi:hypothetical protein
MKRPLLIPCSLPLLLLVFANPSQADSAIEGTQVRIVVGYGNRDLTPLHQLEDELNAAAKAANVGELDGDEAALDGSQASIYMTARHADLLIKTIRPVLKTHEFARDAHIIPGD